jgi:hypothetical protein
MEDAMINKIFFIIGLGWLQFFTIPAHAYMCPATVYINRTNQPWTEYDNKIKKIARKHCANTKYSKCMGKFIKKDIQAYLVYCMVPKDEKVNKKKSYKKR